MPKRLTVSLPDDAANCLLLLATDSNLPQTTIIEQLIRRYHTQLRTLLVIGDVNPHQIAPTMSQADPETLPATPIIVPESSEPEPEGCEAAIAAFLAL